MHHVNMLVIRKFIQKLITMPFFVNKTKNKYLFGAVYDNNLHIFFKNVNIK